MEDTNMNELIPTETATEEVMETVSSEGGGVKKALLVTAATAGTIVVWEKLVKPGVRKLKAALVKRKVAKAKKAAAEKEQDDVDIDDIPEI